METPHDGLFKKIFCEVEESRGLMQLALPAAISEYFDWNTLRCESGDLLDERLLGEFADLLFSVTMGGAQAYVYLLLEHKSAVDRFVAYQLHGYISRIWEIVAPRHPGKGQKKAGPPLVLPIVIYHGARRWSAPRELLPLVVVDEELRQVAALAIPNFRYYLLPLTEDAIRRARQLSALAKLAAFLATSLGSGDDSAALRRSAPFLAAAVQSVGTGRVRPVFSYIMEVTKLGVGELRWIWKDCFEAKMENLIMSDIDVLNRTIREEAKAEGKAEGRAEGAVVGRRRTLLLQLTTRFGEVPAHIDARVHAADEAALEAWSIRILTADSLEDVFTEQ